MWILRPLQKLILIALGIMSIYYFTNIAAYLSFAIGYRNTSFCYSSITMISEHLPLHDASRYYYDLAAESSLFSAESYLECAIILDPYYVEPVIALASLSESTSAERLFIRAIELDYDNPEIYKERGFYWLDEDDETAALLDFQTALDFGLETGLVYYGRGRSYFELKEYDLAIADFNNAEDRGFREFELYEYRAWAYHNSGDYETAIAEYQYCLELRPNDGRTLSNLGAAYVWNGQPYSGLQKLNMALLAGQNNAFVYFSRGLAYERIGNLEAAKADYETAIERDRHYANPYIRLGNLYFAEGNFEEALRIYLRGNINTGGNYSLHYNAGISYFELREYEQCRGQLRTAVRLNSETYEANYRLADCEYHLGNYNFAMFYVNQAIDILDTDPDAYLLRADIAFRSGRDYYAQALEDYLQYASMVSQTPAYVQRRISGLQYILERES